MKHNKIHLIWVTAFLLAFIFILLMLLTQNTFIGVLAVVFALITVVFNLKDDNHPIDGLGIF